MRPAVAGRLADDRRAGGPDRREAAQQVGQQRGGADLAARAAVGEPVEQAAGARLEAVAPAGVEVVVEFQLQIENALDLVGRERVIFVDAGIATPAPFELRRAAVAEDFLHTSHALSPEAVLATYRRVQGQEPPEAWVLCVRGEAFDLGAEISAGASANVAAAWTALLELSVPSGAAATSRP